MTLIERFEAQYSPEPNTGCWLWTGAVANQNKPYGRIYAQGGNKSAHRVSYEMFVGPIPDGLLVLHKCDMPSCVNPGHLFVGTDLDNAIDRNQKKRQARGSRHGQSKLTEADVHIILRDFKLGDMVKGIKPLARRFGVAQSTMRDVVTGISWQGVGVYAAIRKRGEAESHDR